MLTRDRTVVFSGSNWRKASFAEKLERTNMSFPVGSTDAKREEQPTAAMTMQDDKNQRANQRPTPAQSEEAPMPANGDSRIRSSIPQVIDRREKLNFSRRTFETRLRDPNL